MVSKGAFATIGMSVPAAPAPIAAQVAKSAAHDRRSMFRLREPEIPVWGTPGLVDTMG
jgi:hypothetical protein